MRFAEWMSVPLLDVLLIAAGVWLLPYFARLLANPPLILALAVAGAYLVMCAGIWLLKLIERPPSPAAPVHPQWQLYGIDAACHRR